MLFRGYEVMGMRYIAISLVCICLILGSLWLSIGGAALAIGFGAITLVTVIFAAFALGSYWSAHLMNHGANIALRAQESDDRRDAQQLTALSAVIREAIQPGS